MNGKPLHVTRKNSRLTGRWLIAGAKMKIDNVINKEILVTGYDIKASKFENTGGKCCLTLQFVLNDQKYVLFSGSSILIEQMEKYGGEIPFIATIRKIDRYYTLS